LQACGWGSRASDGAHCTRCTSPLSPFDWQYLAFMALLPLLIHSFFVYYAGNATAIVKAARTSRKSTW
jgi:hypothetical protein